MEVKAMKCERAERAEVGKSGSLRAAYVLSAIAAALSTAVSFVGLVFPGVYQGNWGGGVAAGNDLVTLVAAVPLLVTAMVWSTRGSVRGRLLWLGTLYFMVYNYAFYVFGIPVTKLYVMWIGILVFAAYSCALGLGNLDVEEIQRCFSRRTPRRIVGSYMIFVAVMVGYLWISRWVKFVQTGTIPDVNGSAFAYQVIAAVDLVFLVPMFAVAGYLLTRRLPWGDVLGVVGLVQGAIYLAVMAAVCVAGWRLAPGSQLWSGWMINCVVNCGLCLAGLVALLAGVKRPGRDFDVTEGIACVE